MTPPLLTAQDIADILRTTPTVAKSIMLEAHQQPLDLGRGRCRGYRWTKEQLKNVIGNASPQPRVSIKKKQGKGFFDGTRKQALGF